MKVVDKGAGDCASVDDDKINPALLILLVEVIEDVNAHAVVRMM